MSGLAVAKVSYLLYKSGMSHEAVFPSYVNTQAGPQSMLCAAYLMAKEFISDALHDQRSSLALVKMNDDYKSLARPDWGRG